MLSQRILNMEPSATNALFDRVAKLREAGEDIISFNVGEPDFITPDIVRDACKEALDAGKTKYAPVTGVGPLKEAICEKLWRDNQVHYDPDQICISTGAKQAVFNSLMAICDPGDEIIVPTPCWVSYVEMIKLAGGIPVLVETDEVFQLDMKKIKESLTDKTKGIIIDTPNNPTGACYNRESLLELGNLAVEHDFYIIADEVYETLIYDGNVHVCVASLGEDIYERSIVVNGLSKSHAMTGWRVGYTAAPKPVAKGIAALQSHMTSNSTTFVQWAAVEALKNGAEFIAQMHEEFERRRNYVYETVNALPGITCVKPGGAFYVMADVSSYFGKEIDGNVIKDSVDFCNYLLNEAKVAIMPGKAFWAPDTVRIAYPESMENLQEGLGRIRKALERFGI
ncbi:MAG: pyridoxal phosphate-dependent aminotransferase [Lachnospiraceae bacterium]|nr:pyridoxal phosphate-dependent aminotransferase [Lachnospiraceae bacterium]